MEVALTPDLEDLIARQVDEGNYPSPGEVVRDALRLLREQLDNRRKRAELAPDLRSFRSRTT